jgi:hypothetical protein
MKHFSEARIMDAIFVLLVSGSVVLAVIDPSTRPMFGDLTKIVVGPYSISYASRLQKKPRKP